MKRNLLILCLVALLSSCAPSVYQVYDNYSEDPNFSKIEVNPSVLQWASFLVPKEEKKAAKRLLDGIENLDIIRYSGEKNNAFQKEIMKSLKSNGYKEVAEENGMTFYAKRNFGRVKEFHGLGHESDGDLAMISVKGNFSVLDIAKVYQLIKK